MNNIDCKVYMDILPLYVDDALNNETKLFVEEHLSECETCRNEVEMLSRSIVIPVENDTRIFDKIKKQWSLKNVFIFGVSLMFGVLFWVMMFSGLDTATQFHISELIHGGVRALWLLPLIFIGFWLEWMLFSNEKMCWIRLLPTVIPFLIICYVERLWGTGVEGNRNFASLLWYIGFPLLFGSCLVVFLKLLFELSKWIKIIAIAFIFVLFIVGVTHIPKRLDEVVNLQIGSKAWYEIGEDKWWDTEAESLENILKSKRVYSCEQAPEWTGNRDCVILRLNAEYVIVIEESECAYVYYYKGTLDNFQGKRVKYKVLNSRGLKNEMAGMLYIEYGDDKN